MAALTLELVETALVELLAGGQSYSRAGFTFTRASIDGLLKMRSTLKTEAGASSSTGVGFVWNTSGGGGSTDRNWD